MKYIRLYEQREPERQVHRRSDGSVELEEWWLNDARQRKDGPAEIKYRRDGSVEWEAWLLNNKLHRLDGPAWIEYSQEGSVKSEEWWLDGEKIDEVTDQEEFEAWKYLRSVGLV